MAWTYANWLTATVTAAITAVDTTARSFAVATDRRALVRVGDRIAVDTGANTGSYDVAAVTYAPNATVLTVGAAIASAVVAGNAVFGVTGSTKLYHMRLHVAEVSAEIQAAVAANGVSHNSQVLNDYLKHLMAELRRAERSASGGIMITGRLRT